MEKIKMFFRSGFYRQVVLDELKGKILALPGIKQIHSWLSRKK